MTTATLLTWHYLVFWLPMMASAFLMLLSSMRLGHHHGVRHGAHGHTAGHPHIAAHGGHSHGGGVHRGGIPSHQHSTAVAHHSADAGSAKEAQGAQNALVHTGHTPANVVLGLIGAQRAPLPIVLQSFFLIWGFCGFWANRVLIHTPDPSVLQVLPSLGIALVAGAFGARATAELVARVLPPDETAVLSREGLFGLTGKVTFPVTQTSGRIFVYDEYGTLHDESCRVAAGHPPIEKGNSAIVIDVDEKGYLIVKETV
ncbi:MAG TPA: hypothetical protein VFW40_00055 [Capsulimonadaceae bacterium]|nr:hypothetical protein [Capsulimonadaceae bacterium]